LEFVGWRAYPGIRVQEAGITLQFITGVEVNQI